MSLSTKGKGKAVARSAKNKSGPPSIASSGSTSSFSSSLDSDSEFYSSSSEDESSSDEEITQEYLDSLLEKARKNIVASASRESSGSHDPDDDDVIRLDDGKPTELPLPPLDPGSLPTPYFELGNTKHSGPSKARDLDAEATAKASSSKNIPDAPPAPPELTKSGKLLTKKERKALKNKTAGPGWFDLPAPADADLPRLYREVEALRLRNQLDPKRFYRKDEGEGKGIKGLPKHFAIGTIVPETKPFGTASSDNLSRTQRKRTLVDELVDDAEAKSYAKKKFKELQSVRIARGKGTLAKKKAQRKPKW